MSYREIQQECKRRGINAKGSKEELEERLASVQQDAQSFVYIGDPNNKFHGPAFIDAGGYVFEKNGDAVSVSGDLARRLSGNSHFKRA